MNNLNNELMSKRHFFVVEEAGVTSVIRILNSHVLFDGSLKLTVGECGWLGEANKWYIHFDATDEQWEEMRHDLKFKKYDILVAEKGLFGKVTYKEL